MKGPGYDTAQPITPYIHVMVYHCPSSLRKYGNIKMFTGQGNSILHVSCKSNVLISFKISYTAFPCLTFQLQSSYVPYLECMCPFEVMNLI